MLAFTRADTALRRRSSGSLPSRRPCPPRPKALVSSSTSASRSTVRRAARSVSPWRSASSRSSSRSTSRWRYCCDGGLVEHGLGRSPRADGGARPVELADVHLAAGPLEQDGEVGHALGVLHADRGALPGHGPRVALAAVASPTPARGWTRGGTRGRTSRRSRARLPRQRGHRARAARTRPRRARRARARARRRSGVAGQRRSAHAPSSAVSASSSSPPSATSRTASSTWRRVASASPATAARHREVAVGGAVAVRADALDGPGAGQGQQRARGPSRTTPRRPPSAARRLQSAPASTPTRCRGAAPSMAWRPTWARCAPGPLEVAESPLDVGGGRDEVRSDSVVGDRARSSLASRASAASRSRISMPAMKSERRARAGRCSGCRLAPRSPSPRRPAGAPRSPSSPRPKRAGRPPQRRVPGVERVARAPSAAALVAHDLDGRPRASSRLSNSATTRRRRPSSSSGRSPCALGRA